MHKQILVNQIIDQAKIKRDNLYQEKEKLDNTIFMVIINLNQTLKKREDNLRIVKEYIKYKKKHKIISTVIGIILYLLSSIFLHQGLILMSINNKILELLINSLLLLASISLGVGTYNYLDSKSKISSKIYMNAKKSIYYLNRQIKSKEKVLSQFKKRKEDISFKIKELSMLINKVESNIELNNTFNSNLSKEEINDKPLILSRKKEV